MNESRSFKKGPLIVNYPIMKKIVLPVFCLLIGLSPGFTQQMLWSYGTARTLPTGQQEFGILHPFQIGASDNLEVSAQPLLGLTLCPNISFKNQWYKDMWIISSRHAFCMPTMLLRTIRETGWKDFIPDTLEIPYVFNFRNEFLATRQLNLNMKITAKAGFEFSLRAGGDSLPALSHPLVYLRSTTLNNRVLWYAGAQYDTKVYKNFNAMADLCFISSGLGIKDWAIEHKGYFIWNKSLKFAVLIGYKMSYGSYPDKNRYFIIPVADLIWKLNIKRQPAKDMFRQR